MIQEERMRENCIRDLKQIYILSIFLSVCKLCIKRTYCCNILESIYKIINTIYTIFIVRLQIHVSHIKIQYKEELKNT